MTQLSAKVEWYVGRDVDFRQEVLLRDDGQGQGAYIHEWNITDKPLPTEEELRVAGEEHEAHLAATQYLKDRETSYLPIRDQLDMIFWDRENGTEKWQEHIRKVKKDCPPPD